MGANRGVVFFGPDQVEVMDIGDPKMETPQGRKTDHGAPKKFVSDRNTVVPEAA